jgi:hypothetical protein
MFQIGFRLLLALFLLGVLTSCGDGNDVKQEAPVKASEFFHLLRNFPHYQEGADGFLEAHKFALNQALFRSSPPIGFQTAWKNQGPDNIGGRINTIAQNPIKPGEFLVGLTAGGIFKTKDNGLSWYPVFDGMPVLSIAKIVYDPSDSQIVYAATGDPNISSYVFIGQGLYKSLDGGESWDLVGLEDIGVISAFAVHPTQNNILFAGSMGIPLRPGDERGLYRSEDGGLTWEKTLYLSNEAGITDLLIDPVNPLIVYACGWHRVRNISASIVNGNLSRLYRSVDGGKTWNTVTNGLPQETLSRSGIAWSQGSVFVQITGSDQQLKGIYRSDDQGANWIPLVTSDQLNGLPENVLGGFGWYFCKLRVNPQNKQDIFILGIDLWRSRDGGNSWEMAAPPWWTYEVHADKHELIFTAEGNIVIGTDGGTYISYDDAFTWERFDDIPATQFYRIAYNMHIPEFWVGGAQDNGTTGASGEEKNWERYFGGDGFQPAFHPAYPELFFAMWQNGNLVSSQDQGQFFLNFKNGIEEGDRKAWDTPFFISMHDPHPMYFGTTRVYKNDDPFVDNWYPISDNLTDPLEPYLPRSHILSAFGESPLVPGMILAGTADGRLWIQEASSPEWRNITDGLPEQYVTSCQGSPFEAEHLYVTHSGYRYNEFIPHIHKSEDNGNTWFSITGDLPPFAVNDLVVIPGFEDKILFAATDAGVYGTINSGENWHLLGQGMPAIPVYDMLWNPSLNILMAGTHARSFYTFDLQPIIDGLTSKTQAESVVDLGWNLYPNPTINGEVFLNRDKKYASGGVFRYRFLYAAGVPINEWRTLYGDIKEPLYLPVQQSGNYYLEISDGKKSTFLPVIKITN